NVRAGTEANRSIHWRWELDPQAQQFGLAGAFTLVPGYPARRLQLAVNAARPGDIRDLYVYVAVKPGSRAGFELRHLSVAEPYSEPRTPARAAGRVSSSDCRSPTGQLRFPSSPPSGGRS